MKRTLLKFSAQARERDRLIQVQLDITANGFDQLLPRISCNRLGTAAQARAKTSRLGHLRPGEEGDIFTPRTLGRAWWAAINGSGGHGKDEFAIACAVAC